MLSIPHIHLYILLRMTTLVLIIRTRFSELLLFSPDIFTSAVFPLCPVRASLPDISLLGKQICTVCDKKTSLYTVIILTGGSLAESLTDNNIIRIMSDLFILLPLSFLPMATPHTGVLGLVWCSWEACGSALCCTEYVSSRPWCLMRYADLFPMSQFHT